MAIAALIWAAIFIAFLIALKRRWFARFESGFFISLILALAGVALMTASIVGVWGYQAAKRVLEQEIVVELQDVGGIIEGQVLGDIDLIERRLAGLGKTIAAAVAAKASTASLVERLQTVQSMNERYLQLRVIDPAGKLIAESSVAKEIEPVNRIAVAFNLEGKPFVSDAYFSKTFNREVLHVSIPVKDAAGAIRILISARFDLRSELGALIRNSKFNVSGYAVIVDGEGQVIAHPDESRLEHDVSSYPAVQRARETRESGTIIARNAAGTLRLFVYRPLKNPGTLSRDPWVLLTEIDQEEELASLRRLRRELFAGVAAMLVGALLIAHQVTGSIRRPLQAVGEFARKVGAGDLTAHVNVTGRDVAGRLAGTLNEMVAGLQERDHVKEVFGRYIATQVSDKILKGQVNLGGEAREVSILFSDIRNFTGMSEEMTPEQVVSFLNDYFSEMVDAVFENGGVLDKFIGDGLMAVFGSLGDQPDHPRRAVQTALRMRALLAKINGVRSVAGKKPIAIGIGIHTDQVIVGNIGSRKRLEYTVVGDGVNTASRLQGLNKDFGTTILISETTYAAVQHEFECRLMPDAQLRGKTKELKFYEVVSVRTAATV